MVKIDAKTIKFETDPMSEHKIMMEKERRPEFARMLSLNITNQIFEYLKYKVQMRENINIAIKGETRSGKSTVGLAFLTYISKLTKIPINVEKNICANESETRNAFFEQEYYKKVQNANFGDTFQIDEQKEISSIPN